MRGYQVWSLIGRKAKLNAVINYFDKVKEEIQTGSQIRIAHLFRRFKKKKVLLEEQERLRKIQEEKNA